MIQVRQIFELEVDNFPPRIHSNIFSFRALLKNLEGPFVSALGEGLSIHHAAQFMTEAPGSSRWTRRFLPFFRDFFPSETNFFFFQVCEQQWRRMFRPSPPPLFQPELTSLFGEQWKSGVVQTVWSRGQLLLAVVVESRDDASLTAGSHSYIAAISAFAAPLSSRHRFSFVFRLLL